MAGLRKFIPLFDRILVQRFAAETSTKGGILLPEKSVGKMMEATVVAVGAGGRNQNGDVIPVSVAVGDKVLLPEYGGTKIEMNDQVVKPLTVKLADVTKSFCLKPKYII